MGFRDEDEALRARADALARQLEEKEARVAELEAKLAQKAAKLAEKDAALEEAAAGREGTGREGADRAEARLEALRARGAEQARERAAAEKEAAAQAERTAERRDADLRLASVSVWGNVDVVSILPFFFPPTLLVLAWLVLKFGRYAAVLPVAALGVMALAVKYGGRAWARRRWREEEAWARSLPYEMAGYPTLLGKPPSGMMGTIVMLDASDHQLLQLELRFADGEGPKDLEGLVEAFDPELGAKNPVDERRERFRGLTREPKPPPSPHPVFYRPSPVSTRRTKLGSTFVETEHNRAVRRWVRRLEAELLRPLHARHRLARVELRLR